MNELFTFLSRTGLTPQKIERRISSMQDNEIADMFEKIAEILSKQEKGDRSSDFNFVANRTLSGGDYPCVHDGCRIRNVDNLARNSILYADTVYLNNPFDDYAHTSLYSKDLRYQIMGDLKVLYHVKPLLDEGLFKFSTSYIHVCKACLRRLKILTKSHEKKLSKVKDDLLNIFSTQFTYKIVDNRSALEVSGPSDVLEHPIILRPRQNSFENLLKNNLRRSKLQLSTQELIDYRIADHFIPYIIEDLINQNYYANAFNSHYLTNRDIDARLINNNQPQSRQKLANEIANSLGHHLPFIPQTDLKSLINLRKKEGEAFQIYRTSFSIFLQNIKSKSHNLQEAFKDEIEPEIYKMNQTIKTAKKIIYNDIKKDFFLGSTFVSVGLLSNFLSPNVAALLTGLGGINYLNKFADSANKLASVESTVRNNRYFFIWKLKKLQQRNRK
jgi:hypothetical protein